MGKCKQEKCTRDATPGRKKCEQHLEHDRALAKARYAKRKAAGLCTTPGCRSKPVDGRKECRHHLLLNAAADKRRREYA